MGDRESPVRRTRPTREPLVGVVTPVYNGEGLVRACLESVLAQTHEHWDYTIANNGSSDQTLEIANEYPAHDSRIRVHDNVSFVPVIDNEANIRADSEACLETLEDHDFGFVHQILALTDPTRVAHAFHRCSVGYC
jgi:Glycosyl transferase family 2